VCNDDNDDAVVLPRDLVLYGLASDLPTTSKWVSKYGADWVVLSHALATTDARIDIGVLRRVPSGSGSHRGHVTIDPYRTLGMDLALRKADYEGDPRRYAGREAAGALGRRDFPGWTATRIEIDGVGAAAELLENPPCWVAMCERSDVWVYGQSCGSRPDPLSLVRVTDPTPYLAGDGS